MKPTREHATNNRQTYFVTAVTWQRRALFNNARWAELFLDTLLSYCGKGYLLHEYVLMPDHFHALITPEATLERAMQFIKGGFSFRARKELGSLAEVWQRGFSDHRIRDHEDFLIHVEYIFRNPVGRGLVERATDYPYCSAFPGRKKDEVPQWLKPFAIAAKGTAEAVPFQSEAVSFQDEALGRQDEAVGRQGEALGRQGEALGRQGEALGSQDEALGRQDEAVRCQDKALLLEREGALRHAEAKRFHNEDEAVFTKR